MNFKNYLKQILLIAPLFFFIVFSGNAQVWVEMNVQQSTNNLESLENVEYHAERCPTSSFIRVSPNPAHNFIYVSIDPVKECVSDISILDERGNTYMTQTLEMDDTERMGRINVTNLEKGMYFFRIITPWGYETQKFLKH